MDRRHLPLWAQIILEDRNPQPPTPVELAARGRRTKTVPVEQPASVSTAAAGEERRCLVLMAHGSRDPRWRGTFECLYEYVRTRFGQNIKLAYMEFVGPTLMDIARECHAEGVRSLRVLPLFMAGGAHVATDIPEQMQQVRDALPDIQIEAMAPIGEDPRMFAVIQEIIGEHAHSISDSRFTAA